MLSTLNITKVYYLLLDLSFLDAELERSEVRMWLFCLSSWCELSNVRRLCLKLHIGNHYVIEPDWYIWIS